MRLLGIKPKQEYGEPSITLRGEHVRSKAEAIIADWFTRHGVAYQYEPPLKDGFIIKTTRYKSDFLLPEYRAYVEYWGLAFTERNYARKMKEKTDYYRRHGYRLISIYPNNLSDLSRLLTPELASLSAHCTQCGLMLKPTDAYCGHCGARKVLS